MTKIIKKNFLKNISGYLLICPALILIMIMAIYPLLSGITMGFQNNNMMNKGNDEFGKFAGLYNYVKMIADANFLKSLQNTGIWVFFNFTFQMFLGISAALLLNDKLKYRSIYRVAILIPWIVPSVVSALNWRWMYESRYGIINILLIKFGLLSKEFAWLGEPLTAIYAVILASVWKGTPFVMLLVLAGLQTIPNDIHEAAFIDGANRFQVLARITLPYIKDSIVIAGILTIIHTINNFNAIWLMTMGGPINSSEILFTHAYKKAFMQYDFGVSAAVSTVIFSIIAILTMIYIYLVKWGDSK